MNKPTSVFRTLALSAGIVAAGILFLWAACIVVPYTADSPPMETQSPAVSASQVLLGPAEDFSFLPAPSVPAGRRALSVSNIDGITELGHFGRGWPSSLDYSPDGTRIAVGTSRGAEIIDISGWRKRAAYASSSPVLAVLFSPDGKWLAVGQQDGSVAVLDADTAKTQQRLITHTRPVHGLTFSGRGRTDSPPALLASGAEDGSVVVWDLSSGMALHQFRNPLLGYWGYGIRSLAFSPDEKILVTGGDQGYLSRWDLKTGEELPRLQTQYGLLFGIAFSPDGGRLASACGDGTVQIWDYAAEQPLKLLQGHAYGAWSVAWAGNGEELATGAGDGTVKIWDPATGMLRREKTPAFTKIDLLRYSPDDASLAVVSAAERAFLLDSRTLEETRSFDDFIGGLRSAVFSPSGEWAAFAGENGIAYLWNLTRGEGVALGKARPSSNADISAVFSPDGETLAVADGLPGILRLYDGNTLALRTEIRVAGVRAIAFSTDGGILAAGGSGELTVWDTGSWESRKTTAPARLTSLAFPTVLKSEKTYLAGALEDGSVLLWSLDDSGEPVRLSEGGNPPVWSLTASGAVLAAGDDQGGLRIWNVTTGKIMRSFSGYAGSIFAIAVSPDRSLLAAGGIQGSFRIWSVEDGRLLRVVRAHNGWVNGLAFSPDGRWLLSAGSDGIGRIWGLKP
jgi:WD40 repeat protein